jgi:RNA polymerase sigma-70 factor, ECF subfamily
MTSAVAVRGMGRDETADRATPGPTAGPSMRGTGRPGPAGSAQLLEGHRGELTRYCARLLGSPFEAEDAVQETMLRAWRSIGGFEGRASLRTWLHRVAMNVCWEMRRAPQRRPEATDRELPSDGGDDPAEVAAVRDEVRLAFAVALQRLPPRQRAVLILCEVLRWRAKEVADLLGSSVPSVNSALQRARSSLAAGRPLTPLPPTSPSPAEQALVARYVDAFERTDVESLVALLVGGAPLPS